ncbi:hypothetical protein [Methanolobus vulcani]|uniref:Uncharacterized protein n=1 Tax=Methanolobus vulcani TaxID=38026 RepID=A0A7Z8KQ96_9EURY|nr:hypothetical protein [Methanolobus vulcani]TQD27671.1 hypothetical protein FKV42_03175 [Methanolobus vulcani]
MTSIADQALENEGIDTKYINLKSIVQTSPNNTLLTFRSTEDYTTSNVYSNVNLSEAKNITFFAANLDRYEVYSYTAQPENGRIYDKDVVTLSEIYGYGEDYGFYMTNNSIEIINPLTDKATYSLSNYTIISDKNKASTIADEINSKYANAQQPLPIDKEKTFIIIDTTHDDQKTRSIIEIWFYNNELSAMHIEETTNEENVDGFFETIITRRVKYYNQDNW